MSVFQTKASQPNVPEAGSNLTASVSTVQNFDLTPWRGRFVTVQVDGANVYLSAGAGVAATDVTAPATSGANIGLIVRDGQDKDFFVPEGTQGSSTKYWLRAVSGGTATVTVVPTSR